MPMGPLELMDMVGLDIANQVGEQLELAPGQRQCAVGAGASRASSARRRARASTSGKRGKPKREEAAYDQAELERLGRELVQPMLDEAERALADQAWWRAPITSMPA